MLHEYWRCSTPSEPEELLFETDAMRMCELLVGLPCVNVVGVGDWLTFLRISISTRGARPECPRCGGGMWLHDRVEIERVDLPRFGRQTRLISAKNRWRCPNSVRGVVVFAETDERIDAARAVVTDRAGRWSRFQVGHHGRMATEVANDSGCDWHTVMDAVVLHGRASIDDRHRIGTRTADEITNWTDYRTRALLYAGQPNWAPLTPNSH